MIQTGYTNSQTWEAWRDSFNVLWDNTEIVFLISVTVSLGAVIYTWMYYPKSENNVKDEDSSNTVSTLVDDDVIQETGQDEEDSSDLTQKELLKKALADSLTPEDKMKERESARMNNSKLY
ncbi:hypothetical protein Avbf_08323 [Armadillidium vulgare]|nr:hypothetical protein Avbf_08323 [Armadillidium vulgare]